MFQQLTPSCRQQTPTLSTIIVYQELSRKLHKSSSFSTFGVEACTFQFAERLQRKLLLDVGQRLPLILIMLPILIRRDCSPPPQHT